jgi:hypothetical protein
MRLSLLSAVITITVFTKRIGVQAIRNFDDDIINSLVENTNAQIETVYTSFFGTTIARCTALLSTICSILIITFIFRSATKLSTPYHRIMFGMSAADAMGSFAIFCSTWLMPKEMIYKQFEGAVYGNTATCTAQGFMFLAGMIASFGFNMTLCVYYVCVIKYKFSDERFSKRAEPILFFLAFLIPVSLLSPLVVADLFAPTPFDFVCTEVRYPYWCPNSGIPGDEVCIPSPTFIGFKYSLLTLYLCSAAIIIGSMYLVCEAVYSQERSLDLYMRNFQDTRRILSTNRKKENDRNKNKIKTSQVLQSETKTVMFQAIAYVSALLACQIFPLMCLLKVLHTNRIYMYFHVTLRPLQGFFNFLIFTHHKVCNMRRSNNVLTRWQAFRQVLMNPEEEPTMFVGNINIVFKLHHDPVEQELNEEQDAEENDEDSVMDISFSDANGEAWSWKNLSSTVSPTGMSYGPATYRGDSSNAINTKSSGLSYADHSSAGLRDHDLALYDDNLTSSSPELRDIQSREPLNLQGSQALLNSRKTSAEMLTTEDLNFKDDDLKAFEISNSEAKPKSTGSAVSSWFSRVTRSVAGSRDISHDVSSLGK